MGFLSVSILNINNYRDLTSDQESNKKTIAVKLGEKRTLTYQRFLLVFGFLGVFSSMGYYLFQLLNLSGSTYYIEMFLLFGVFSPSAVFLSRYHSEMKELLPGDREELNKAPKKQLSHDFVALYWYTSPFRFISVVFFSKMILSAEKKTLKFIKPAKTSRGEYIEKTAVVLRLSAGGTCCLNPKHRLWWILASMVEKT
jgi:hypothetical protein